MGAVTDGVRRTGVSDPHKSTFLCYLTSEYTASLSTKSPEFTGPCFTFMELAPKTLRKFKKYAGNPLALKASGPSINE